MFGVEEIVHYKEILSAQTGFVDYFKRQIQVPECVTADISYDALQVLINFLNNPYVTDWVVWYALANQSPNHQNTIPQEYRVQFVAGVSYFDGTTFAIQRSSILDNTFCTEDDKRSLDSLFEYYWAGYCKSYTLYYNLPQSLNAAVLAWFRTLQFHSHHPSLVRSPMGYHRLEEFNPQDSWCYCTIM